MLKKLGEVRAKWRDPSRKRLPPLACLAIIAVIAVIGFALQAVLPCLFAAAVMNLLLGGAGFFLSALFLSRGQR